MSPLNTSLIPGGDREITARLVLEGLDNLIAGRRLRIEVVTLQQPERRRIEHVGARYGLGGVAGELRITEFQKTLRQGLERVARVRVAPCRGDGVGIERFEQPRDVAIVAPWQRLGRHCNSAWRRDRSYGQSS
jgi:hypothetical protein